MDLFPESNYSTIPELTVPKETVKGALPFEAPGIRALFPPFAHSIVLSLLLSLSLSSFSFSFSFFFHKYVV